MNPFILDFAYRHSYISDDAITVPVTLVSGSFFVDVSAKLDTGSKFCVMQPGYADLLELDLSAGIPQRISTATGTFQAFEHEITLSVFGLEWQTVIHFAESASFPVNVVGRVGFLDHLRIALVDYEQTLYASLYDQA